MRGQLTGTIFLLALLLCPALRAADGPFIQALQIRGSGRPVEIETHAGQTLDRARIARDVRRLWATGWFEDIRVETSETPEGIQVVFTLVEKPRLYLRRVVFEPESRKRPLGLKQDAPVDAAWAQQVAAALRRQLIEEGYANAAVESELIPVGFQQADLLLRVEPGRRTRVREVRFSGSTGLPPEELRRALRSTRARRLLPGVPGLWRGWRLFPPFSDARLRADLERLRSLYLSRGYFDARVGVAAVEVVEGKATVTVGVNAGRRYRVRRVEVVGGDPGEEIAPHLDGSFPVRKLCHCLLEARRTSERQGELPFAVRLEVQAAPEPDWAWWESASGRQRRGEEPSAADSWVALTATIAASPAYRVGRIEFRGHHAFSDSTLRRALLLEEGELFDQDRLRRSLARLNRMGFLEPVTLSDVRAERDPDGRRVHLIIPVKESKRGRWSLAGPLGPLSAFGPLQFTIKSRLPAWGQGPLALSTYNLVFSLLALPAVGLSPLSLTARVRWQALVGLERPYLPGERWRSGFLLSPQLGWRGALTSYGFTQARQAAGAALQGGSAFDADLYVAAQWRAGEREDGGAETTAAGPSVVGAGPAFFGAGVLRCQARKPSWKWLRAAGAVAANLLLTATPL